MAVAVVRGNGAGYFTDTDTKALMRKADELEEQLTELSEAVKEAMRVCDQLIEDISILEERIAY